MGLASMPWNGFTCCSACVREPWRVCQRWYRGWTSQSGISRLQWSLHEPMGFLLHPTSYVLPTSSASSFWCCIQCWSTVRRHIVNSHSSTFSLIFSNTLTTSKGVSQWPRLLKREGKTPLIGSSRGCANLLKGMLSWVFWYMYTLIFNLFSARRAMIVDLALTPNGSQLIASALPNVCSLCLLLVCTWTDTYSRRIRTNERSSTIVSVAISSPFEAARQVQKLFGSCTCNFAFNYLYRSTYHVTLPAVIEWLDSLASFLS